MGDDEEATVRTLMAYHEGITTLIQQYCGRVVDFPGDNLLADFGSVVDAVQCAVAMQPELTARNAALPVHRRMQFRMGINLGNVRVGGDQIYGDGVNIAARLEGLAEVAGAGLSGPDDPWRCAPLARHPRTGLRPCWGCEASSWRPGCSSSSAGA